MPGYRPAEFEFVKLSSIDSTLLQKGVPQVNQSFFVTDTFHAPPAQAVTTEVYADYPGVDESPLPSVPLFYTPMQKEKVRPSNFQSPLAAVPGVQPRVPPARKQDGLRTIVDRSKRVSL